MTFARLPDWLIYLAAIAALLVAAVGRRQHADAPSAPPPIGSQAQAALTPDLGFDPAHIVQIQRAATLGAAFSVSGDGVWLTAGHLLDGCVRPAVLVGPGRGIVATVSVDRADDIAVLKTSGGGPALPLAPSLPLAVGAAGFHPGFPQGQPGEVASLLLRSDRMDLRNRPRGPGLIWTEVGRTDGLRGMLNGLSGAPVLDDAGQVVGLTLAEAPRRGRLYAASVQQIRAALARSGASATSAAGQPVSVDNYGRVADALRRDLSVAAVVCAAT